MPFMKKFFGSGIKLKSQSGCGWYLDVHLLLNILLFNKKWKNWPEIENCYQKLRGVSFLLTRYKFHFEMNRDVRFLSGSMNFILCDMSHVWSARLWVLVMESSWSLYSDIFCGRCLSVSRCFGRNTQRIYCI